MFLVYDLFYCIVILIDIAIVLFLDLKWIMDLCIGVFEVLRCLMKLLMLLG